MQHEVVTMRDWLGSAPDDDLMSVVELAPSLRRVMRRHRPGGLSSRAERRSLPSVRAHVHGLSEQSLEDLGRTFLAGVAQQLRVDGYTRSEVDDPDAEQLRSMLLHLPAAHGRFALHALLAGSAPASPVARAHAQELFAALEEAHPEMGWEAAESTPPTPEAAPAWDWHTVADTVERLRLDADGLAPELRTAAAAVAAGRLPADPRATPAPRRPFAAGMTELAAALRPLVGDEPVAADLGAVQVHFDRAAERERSAERAELLASRDEIRATVGRLEAGGGSAFLVELYEDVVHKIERQLMDLPPVTSAAPPDDGVPSTDTGARELLADRGLDDELVSAIRPWQQLCGEDEYLPRGDVSAVVAAEPSEVPSLLERLDALGVLRVDDVTDGVAIDALIHRCLALLPEAR